MEGRPAYVLRVTPKNHNKYLINGRIWVDATDYSIVRIEGSPARNPSFWTHNVHFVHTYQKVSPFWFAASTHSMSEIRIFGEAELTIQTSHYTLNTPDNRTAKAEFPAGGRAMREGRHLILALIGAALFTWVVTRVGLPAILQQLNAMRLALPILLTLSVCRLLLQTTAWSGALKGEGISIAPERLIGIRLASQSMGYLTFLGAVLSEPLKIKLLRAPAESTIKATLLDSGAYWFTSVLVTIIGCLCAAFLAVHDAHHAWIALPVTLLSLVLFLIARTKPILSCFVRVLGRHCPSWLAHGEALERSVRNCRRQPPALVSRMFWIDVACQLLTVSEVAVVVWSLRLPIVTVLAIEGITRALKMVSGWIPARLGADEGGAMSAFLAAGLSPVSGLTLALTRRMRDLLWALIGLAWLVWRSPQASRDRSDSKKRTRPLAQE